MKLIFALLCMLFSAIISHVLGAATADTVKNSIACNVVNGYRHHTRHVADAGR